MVRHMVRWLVGLSLITGCATRYAYTFRSEAPIADGDVHADVVVDPDAAAVMLHLTNTTDEVVQVDWANITFDGRALRPATDLGWIRPGATATAALVPLALPRTGAAAAAYEGRRFDLTVPVIVRREPRQYHYALFAHVREL